MLRMKKVCLLCFAFVMILSVVPVVSSLLFGVEEASVSGIVSQSRISLRSGRIRTVTVTDPATGEKEVMSERDYLCGIVASQMPMEYDDEVLRRTRRAFYPKSSSGSNGARHSAGTNPGSEPW